MTTDQRWLLALALLTAAATATLYMLGGTSR